MRNIIYTTITALILISCHKESDLRKGGYIFSASASYFFEGEKFPVLIPPDTITLIDISDSSLIFFRREMNNWGQINEDKYALKVLGNIVSGTLLGYEINGILVRSKTVSYINGEITFDAVHEHLCTDGIYTFPCDTLLQAMGTFIIAPL